MWWWASVRVADEQAGAEGAAAVVDLGLRKIEGIGALDVARAHVVADGVSDDLAAWIDDESEFGLGYGPGGVVADFDVAVGACDFVGYGFEEELGAFGGVDAVVEVSAACVLGFGDAGAAAAVVGDAGGPDLLIFDGSEEFLVNRFIARSGLRGLGPEVGVEIVVGDECVEGGFGEAVGFAVLLDEDCFCGCDRGSRYQPFAI